MSFIAYLLAAYLVGSIPWGYLIAKLHGINIQKRGSGSIGATNIYRTLGLSYALIVFLLDILKGLFVMLVAKFSINNHYEIAALALAVILGHTFSIFLKGRGGKGVATTFGVLLILIGWKVMGVVLLIALCLVLITRYMSLTNLILIWIFPSFFVFVNPDFAYFTLGVVVTLLIYWEHRKNIDRLKEGKELQLAVKIGVKSTRRTTPSIANVAAPMRANKKGLTSKKRVVKKPVSKPAANKPSVKAASKNATKKRALKKRS